MWWSCSRHWQPPLSQVWGVHQTGSSSWMWVMGLCAATLNYAEVVLGITFRVKSPVLGEYVCTRSHVYEGGIRWRSLGRGLALISALMVLLPPVSYLTQTQAVAGALALAMDWPQSLVALVIAVTIMLVVVGELKSIAATSEVLVTLMVAAYLGVGWWALAASGSVLKPALLSIFKHAFSPAAAAGGFAGATVRQALRYGLARGAFSCNAATGSAMTTHAAAVVDHPARQGIWGVVEVFLDTLVLCSTTGLVILASGTWTSGVTAGELVALSFDYFFPGFGGKFAALCALAFGWTTMLGMYYATTKNFTYLLGAGSRWLFPALYYYRAAIFFTMLVAPRIHVDIIWALQDLFTALSVAVNLGAMFLLGSVVAKKTREFFG
ncbi:MAG: alanine:cation symporter family protein [Bacillota bacterium]